MTLQTIGVILLGIAIGSVIVYGFIELWTEDYDHEIEDFSLFKPKK